MNQSQSLIPKISQAFIRRNQWSLVLSKFYSGFAPLAFINSLTEDGASGHASAMLNTDCLTELLTQGPGIANLTNGTQAGVVTELINFIIDKAIANDQTYGVGTTKLFQISSTTVANTGTFPHTISSCTRGESAEVLKGNLYYFYNTTTGGDIGRYDLINAFTDNWGSTIPTGAATLQNAIHPCDKKEDLMVFGNGRYVGVYNATSNILAPTKLDFGNDAICGDVLYNSGFWYLAINSGVTGANRTEGQIYLYDGAATTSTLADETGVGMQRIGFLYRLNGIVYVAYQDLSSTGFIIGYINGKKISPLARFTGTLPTFAQKTLYKGTILFLSGNLAYSAGAFIDTLPFQLSQHATTGYATTGAIAAPFGVPMIASTDGVNYKLVKFNGFDTNANWKSVIYPMSLGKQKAYIDEVVVLTKTLGANASCALTIEANQATATSTAQTITGTGKNRHYFTNFGLPGPVEDFRIVLDWTGGSAVNDCAIRGIKISGHWAETAA